jgi:archaellum component FlaC
MSDKTFKQENLARIENRIEEVKVRLWELQERLRTLEDKNLDQQQTHALIDILIEHLTLMEIRLEQTQDDIRADQMTGKTGWQDER